MRQMAFQEVGTRALQGVRVCIAGGFAVIQPSQEFQLREQVIWRGSAVDLQAEVLIVEFVFEHHVAGWVIQQPGTFE